MNKEAENSYLERYEAKMLQAPDEIHRFCDSSLSKELRAKLVEWIRSVDCVDSCQALQIKYSFSIPNQEAINAIKELNKHIISLGSGTGYWEYLLKLRGCSIECYDSNVTYPSSMRFMNIKVVKTVIYKENLGVNFSILQTGGPEKLLGKKNSVLLISWPDENENSTFSKECLDKFEGDTILHVGELVGCTQSANPWGQSTAKIFQLALFEQFRKVLEIKLPNWPGHMDSLSIWKKAEQPVECDGGLFQYLGRT